MEELELGIELGLEVSKELSKRILGEALSSEEYQNNRLGGSLAGLATGGVVASLVGVTAPLSLPAILVAGATGVALGSKAESNVKKTANSLFQQVGNFFNNVFDDVADFFDDYEAHISEGILSLEEENYQEAIISFNRALELNPECLEAYFYRGCIYSDCEYYTEAIADFTQVINLNPQVVEAYDYRGHIYALKQQYNQAINNYNKSISLDDSDPDIYFRRAHCYLKLESYELAQQDFNRVINLIPDCIPAIYWRGCLSLDFKKYQEAFNDFELLSTLDNSDEDEEEIFILKIQALTGLKKYDQALVYCNNFIQKTNDNVEGYFIRASLYMELEKYELAINDYSQIIKNNCKNLEAYLLLNRCFLAIQELAKIIDNLNVIISLFNYSELKEYEEEIFNITEYITEKLNEGKPDIALFLVKFSVGITLKKDEYVIDNIYRLIDMFSSEEVEKYETSILDYISSIGKRSNQIESCFIRASLYIKLEKYDLAIDNYSQIIRNNGKNLEAYLLLNNCFLAKEEFINIIDNLNVIISFFNYSELKKYEEDIFSLTEYVTETINEVKPDIALFLVKFSVGITLKKDEYVIDNIYRLIDMFSSEEIQKYEPKILNYISSIGKHNNQIESCFMKVTLNMKLNQYDVAIKDCLEIKNKQPDNINVYLILMEIYMIHQQYEKAIKIVKQGIKNCKSNLESDEVQKLQDVVKDIIREENQNVPWWRKRVF
jgi:tetratricopeptide (TPR) repeat protein